MTKYDDHNYINAEEPNRLDLSTIHKLKETAIVQNRSDAINSKIELVRVLEKPMLGMMPIKHITPSLLYLLLGIGNKLICSFPDFL